MKKITILILVLLTMQRCSNQNQVIKSAEVKEIIITSNRSGQKSNLMPEEISNKDSVKLILEKLNNCNQEPIKFYPTHTLKLIYNDNQEDSIFCSGMSMKFKGLTYKTNESIKEIIGE